MGAQTNEECVEAIRTLAVLRPWSVAWRMEISCPREYSRWGMQSVLRVSTTLPVQFWLPVRPDRP